MPSDKESSNLPGVHAAPNIQARPDLYEIENRALDPHQLIEQAMRAVLDWNDKIVLDLGAGTGFFVPRFHETARHVIAVEPHDASRLQIMERVSRLGLPRVSVMTGSAEQVWLPAQSVDIVHARFAYFFAPDCEPGLLELSRIIRPGGAAFIIDNDLTNGTFADWLNRAYPRSAEQVENFWREQGFELTRICSEWLFESRADLEAVVANEFPAALVPQLLAEHTGLSIEYWYCLYHKRY